MQVPRKMIRRKDQNTWNQRQEDQPALLSLQPHSTTAHDREATHAQERNPRDYVHSAGMKNKRIEKCEKQTQHNDSADVDPTEPEPQVNENHAGKNIGIKRARDRGIVKDVADGKRRHCR
jgi:hypothetical protein